MTKDEMKKVVCQAIDEATEKIHETVLRIESEPELGYKETKTAAKVESYMKELGLTPQTGLALTGVKTCVDGGKKGPAVAVLAELDAVGTPDSPKADPLTGAAHTCGHFLQMASMLAACTGIVKSDVMKDLAESGMTMIVVTHEMRFAREVSSRTIFLDGGVIGEDKPSHELFSHPESPRLVTFLNKVL